MNFGDFHGFSAAFERAGLTKDEISELTDAALNRYKLRVSRGFKIWGDYKPWRNKLILDLAFDRNEKIKRAQQSIKLCKIEWIGFDSGDLQRQWAQTWQKDWIKKMVGYKFVDRISKSQYAQLFKGSTSSSSN